MTFLIEAPFLNFIDVFISCLKIVVDTVTGRPDLGLSLIVFLFNVLLIFVTS